MSHGLILPPGAKASCGRDLFPPPDVVRLSDGRILRARDDRSPLNEIAPARTYRGPHDLIVLVSLDDRGEPWGTLLHLSLSLPKGYPDWDLIYAIARAFFGNDVDAMMPIPREEAYIHGAVEAQRSGRVRQVFHVVEMPQAWPSENEE